MISAWTITAEDGTSAFVSHQPSTRIALDPTSVVVFDDEMGAVFQPDQPGIATVVSPTGSKLRLTNALVGNQALVLTLPFFAVPRSNTVRVTPVDWPTSGDGERTWKTRGPSDERVRYVVRHERPRPGRVGRPVGAGALPGARDPVRPVDRHRAPR